MSLPDIHRSARKHYATDHLGDEDLRHAYGHVLNSRPLDDEDDPRRWIVLGADESGRVLELVVLVFDDGYELLIHAMKARKQFMHEIHSGSADLSVI
ncbi:toxin [Actinomyces oris]|uniref:Toxin n=1 Tax=Actinomyces oris TaxID=544580 RepID=A0A1Q8I4I1_9ACTO|nr:toxin [Actinomyces oris]OLL16001.1 toxin [Actinomyces oris]OLO54986.1 toxin [Actinomyces oris]